MATAAVPRPAPWTTQARKCVARRCAGRPGNAAPTPDALACRVECLDGAAAAAGRRCAVSTSFPFVSQAGAVAMRRSAGASRFAQAWLDTMVTRYLVPAANASSWGADELKAWRRTLSGDQPPLNDLLEASCGTRGGDWTMGALPPVFNFRVGQSELVDEIPADNPTSRPSLKMRAWLYLRLDLFGDAQAGLWGAPRILHDHKLFVDDLAATLRRGRRFCQEIAGKAGL